MYAGDGRFNPDELDRAALRAIAPSWFPEARISARGPTAALEAFARAGGEIIVFSESPLDPELVRTTDGQVLFDFWNRYRDEDRERILASVQAPPSARIESSDQAVTVTRYALGDRQVLHLLDYRYDQGTDTVTPGRDLRLRIPWEEGSATVALIDLDGERDLTAKVENGTLVVEIPELAIYGVLVLTPDAALT